MDELEEGFWQTKDGRIIKIGDMDDDHLINSIRFLKKVVGRMRFARDLRAFSALNFVQGEMASYAIESDIMLDAGLNNEEWLEIHTAYKDLIEEAKRRDLTMFICANIFSTLWRSYVEV